MSKTKVTVTMCGAPYQANFKIKFTSSDHTECIKEVLNFWERVTGVRISLSDMVIEDDHTDSECVSIWFRHPFMNDKKIWFLYDTPSE